MFKKHVISVLLLAVLCSISCKNKTTPGPDLSEVSYEVQKLTLEQQEQQDPLRFLSTDGTYRENFWGEFVLKGTVTNSATVAVYKDIQIEVSFYSKTKTLLGTKSHTFYEYCKPGNSIPINLKLNAPSGTKTLGWSVTAAAYSAGN